MNPQLPPRVLSVGWVLILKGFRIQMRLLWEIRSLTFASSVQYTVLRLIRESDI